MKKIINLFIWGFLVILVGANIFLFTSSISLGDQISGFENKIVVLHKENLNLERQVSDLSSLKFAADKAQALNFTKTGTPTYLENLGVAYNYNP